MKKLIAGIIITLIFYSLNSCNGLIDFIPPNLKEKLAISAIIKNGSNQNLIIIEKTFQNEYPADINSSLENLSVIIKTESDVLFEYFNSRSNNRTDTVHLPASLNFIPGQKYTLLITEKNSDSVTSKIVVPHPPLIPEISIEGSVQTILPPPLECHNPVKAIVLNINFKSDQEEFYYLDIEGYLKPFYKDTSHYLIDYDIIECNSPYLKTLIYGFESVGFPGCILTPFTLIPIHTYIPCFFDGKTIPDDICNIKFKINLNSEFYDYKKPIRITINSIPKDFYTYEKSYHSYLENLFDPFSDPVYIRGNIENGYGIFSIYGGNAYPLMLPTD